MDAFYASVEQRDHPSLRGKPVAVGWSGNRGVVAAASYEARKYGVRSAMPSITALRLCPQLNFVKARFSAYREISGQIREVFRQYTDLIEPLSLDEAFLDVSENKIDLHSGTLIANRIRDEIFEATELTASAGVSINKFVAKIASDINKPNGIKVITPPEVLPFLETLPIEKFFGIGKVTATRMRNMGISDGLTLKAKTEMELVKRFGKAGRFFYKMVRGEDNRRVNPNRIQKSIGVENTYREDFTSLEGMEAAVEELAVEVYRRAELKENFGRTLTLKVKFDNFEVQTRSRTESVEIKKLEDVKAMANNLLRTHFEDGKRVRLLGLSFSNLSKDKPFDIGQQLSLDFWKDEK